jgi:hypothetical protein
MRGCLRVYASVLGKIDEFPAFEAYAKFNGVTKELFTAAVPPGKTVFDLVGDATRSVAAAAVFP